MLHWLVVALIFVQYYSSGSIARTHHVSDADPPVDPFDLLMHTVHNRTGMLIFILLLIRLALRYRFGQPRWSVVKPRWEDRLAASVHYGLYGVLAMQAVTGAVASYFWWPVSTIHRGLFVVFLALLFVHIIGALSNLVFNRSEAVFRMSGLRRTHSDASA